MSIIKTIRKGLRKIALKLEITGTLRAMTDRDDMTTCMLTEDIGMTIKSLMTGVEEFNANGIDSLTPKALMFITRIEKNEYASYKLKEIYNDTRRKMVAMIAEKQSPERAELVVTRIEKAWELLMSKKDRYIYISSLYKTIQLSTFKEANQVIPIPTFDSYVVGNCLNYIAFYLLAIQNKDDKNKKADYAKKGEDELRKIKYTASQFLSSNKLHAFIDGFFKAHFNVLAPFTHGANNQNGIFVPVSSGFAIGDKVAGLRHPVMTGVVIFTVLGFTEDSTIKIDEVHFRRFQADSDGDFFLVSDMLYYLLSGKK